MTVLEIAQDAAAFLGVAVPSALMGETSRDAVELRAAIYEAAADLLDAYDWQAVKSLKTVTGDGTTTQFALPSDFHKMPKDGNLWSSRIDGPLYHVIGSDELLQLDVRSYEFVRGVWCILGGNIEFRPAPEATETVKYYYQSNFIWGGTKARPTADEDTFSLDDRLLKLGVIWRWKHAHGLPYAEHMESYELALMDAIARDRGARVLRRGSGRLPGGVRVAYPKAITP